MPRPQGRAAAIGARREAGQGAELAGEVRLVRIALGRRHVGQEQGRVGGQTFEGASEAMDPAPGFRCQANVLGEAPREMALAVIEALRSEAHTSEPQSLMRISYVGFCLQTKTTIHINLR